MTVRILSTMTQSVAYVFYNMVGDLPVERDRVTVRGGAGIPSARSGFGNQSSSGDGTPIWTADGIVTVISDEQHDRLKEHKLFQGHIEKGLIKVLKYEIEGSHRLVEKESKSMSRDSFGLLTKSGIDKRIRATTKLLDQETELRL